jgi:hypothetical protein
MSNKDGNVSNFSIFWRNNKGIFGYSLIGLFVVSLIAFWIWYGCWVNFIEQHEYGFTYNKFTGEIKPVSHSGWLVATPWKYGVHAIDTRPYQVAISANQRILNAKLVRFNPKGLMTFIQWHGRDAGDDVNKLTEILKCYAFDRDEGRDCPFLTVISVLSPSQGMPVNEVGAGTSTVVPDSLSKVIVTGSHVDVYPVKNKEIKK